MRIRIQQLKLMRIRILIRIRNPAYYLLIDLLPCFCGSRIHVSRFRTKVKQGVSQVQLKSFKFLFTYFGLIWVIPVPRGSWNNFQVYYTAQVYRNNIGTPVQRASTIVSVRQMRCQPAAEVLPSVPVQPVRSAAQIYIKNSLTAAWVSFNRHAGSKCISRIQCCGSGSVGSVCFWASWIRIRVHKS